METIEIVRGTNPDVVFEFFSADSDLSPPLDISGAALTATSNIPGIDGAPVIALNPAGGVVVIGITEAISLAAKTFTDYWITVRAVDGDSKIHKATVGVRFA